MAAEQAAEARDFEQPLAFISKRFWWWHSFRHSGQIDSDGFAIFDEDPHAEKIRHTGPLPTDVTE
jgi:hypothetical protein